MVSLANRDPYGLRCPLCHGEKSVGGAICVRCAGTGKGPGAPPDAEEIRKTLQEAGEVLNEALMRSSIAISPEYYARLYNLRGHVVALIERMSR